MKTKSILLAITLYCDCIHGQIPYNYNSSGITLLTAGSTNLNYNEINLGSSSYHVSSTAQLSAVGFDKVHLQNGFKVTALSGNGIAHIYNNSQPFDIVSFHPNGFSNIPQYSRFELGIKLPASIQSQIHTFLTTYSGPAQGLNPYDPDQIKVECQITPPSGPGFLRFGFYYQPYSVSNNAYIEGSTDYPFRIRIAPPAPGLYNCAINIYRPGQPTLIYNNIKFNVAGSTNPGNIILASNVQKMKFENGDPFFGIGQNLPGPLPVSVDPAVPNDPYKNNPCFNYQFPVPGDTYGINSDKRKANPRTHTDHRSWINNLADHHGNFARIRLDPWSFPIEHADIRTMGVPTYALEHCLTNYQHNQMFLGEFDNTLSLCEQRGVYIMLNIFNDGLTKFLGADGLSGWQDFPYRTILPGATEHPGQSDIQNFFAYPDAIAAFKKQLYYITARWGYSTNIAMWEFINETENINLYSDHKNTIKNWVCEMSGYMQSFSPRHLTTNGTTTKDFNNLVPASASCIDIFSQNAYSREIDDNTHNNYKDNLHEAGALFFSDGKPFLWGELGLIHCVDDNQTNNGTSWTEIEKNNDRSFHNNIWATTVSGNVAAGLNWHDPEQLYTPHRNNFDALAYFVNHVDWSQVLVPQRYQASTKNETTGNGDFDACPGFFGFHKLYNLYMQSLSGDYVVGWSMIYPSFWAYDKNHSNFSNYQDLIHCQGYEDESSIVDYNVDGNGWSNINHELLFCEPPIEIRYMNAPNRRYRMELFNTQTNSSFSIPVFSDGVNNIKVNISLSNHGSGFSGPDIAYIIHDDADQFFSSKIAGGNDNEPFIITDDPKSISENAYDPDLVVATKTNEEIKNYWKKTYPGFDNISNTEMQKISVFPNPASNYIYFDYNNAFFKTPQIIIYDLTGKTIRSTTHSKKIEVSDLDAGMYLVTFKNNEFEKSFKIAITH